MVKRTVILTLFVSCCFTSVVFATEPNCHDKYITPGRASMLEHSLSGLRNAYETFDNGIHDSNCSGNDKRELTFLHAVTRTAMLFIDNNGLTVDGNSFLELADAFGVKVIGDYFDQLDVNVPLAFIVAWGRNNEGQCNVPSPNTGFVAVAAGGFHNLGLKSDGSIVAWGHNYYGQCDVPDPNTGFVAVSAGDYHSLAVKSDGSIVAWGQNNGGQCDVPDPNMGFVAVAAGGNHSLAIKSDGSIVAWGYNNHGQCNVPDPNTGFVAIAAGGEHSLGLKSDGSIVAWGRNNEGQCTVPSPNTGFVAVAAGGFHSLGLKSDGSLVAWGFSGYGQCNVPEPNTSFVAVAAGDNHSLAIKSDGSIVAWGRNNEGQCTVPSPNTGFVAVAAGQEHSLAIPKGRYKIPPGAPNADEISGMIHNSIIPEINDIIAELDSISDTASNRFRIYFEPNETGLENDLEVDYGEVLVLKGLLLAFKSELESRQAYDVFLDVNETLLHKLLYEDGVNPEEPNFAELAAIIGIADPCNISINDDFLDPYPDLLMVLPTANDSNNGTAILAKSKKDLIASIDNYFKAINYISAETDPQEDDLVYIDPNDKYVFDMVKQKLTTLQNSLKNDTAATYPLETTKTYNVYSSSKLIGQLVLVYDLTGLGGDANSLTFTKPGVPTPWEVNWFGRDNSEIEAELECHSSGHYWGGYLEGTLNNIGNITDVNFYYWGDCNNSCCVDSVCSYDSYCCDVEWDSICADEARYDLNCNCGGTLEKLSCQLISTKVTNISINLNPIFGSPKYPKPVSPRDLLPQFDANNQPLAGTFGDGLGDDATLGGILPGMTQQNWTDLLGLSAALKVVPNVVGTAAADANTTIVDANLVVGTVTTAYSNTVAVGKVISQNPVAGKAVAIGSAVSYVKSLGKPIVPDVVGMTASDANTAITSVDNLKVGTVTTAYDNNDAGKVISQSPIGGTKVLIGSAVNYLKSLGSKPIVPDVRGEMAADANTAIKSVNLKVGTITTAYSDIVDAGKVISQSPIKNTVVLIGSAVNYKKSLGKPIVPNIVGKTAAAANTAITSVDNLKVGLVTAAYSDTVAAGKVISQDPNAHTAVAIGSAVKYVKSLGKKPG